MTVLTVHERHLVPRWRPFTTTLALGELATIGDGTSRWQWDEAIGETRRDWLSQRSLESALDFAQTAALLDRLDEAQDAVAHILGATELPTLVRQSVLPHDDGWPMMVLDAPHIAHVRAALRAWPRDPTLWTDLALFYCGRGLDRKAERAFLVALDLAPTNRYVLRCAARFFVHTNDPERAMALLRRSQRTRRDPWLASAEIAASQVAGRTPVLAKVGERLLGSGRFADQEITELATSLGTLAMESGKVRRAKSLFQRGVACPNDNVKAQLQWVAKTHVEVLPGRTLALDAELDHEARALECQKMENWVQTIENCEKWGEDELFSDRPFIMGSCIAIEALGDVGTAEKLARRGLRANRNDVCLLNNLAVSLAMQGRADDAERYLKEAKRHSSSAGEQDIMLEATEGMVRFRQGEVESGRGHYVEAIRRAKAEGAADSALRAAVFFVGEEVVAETPGSSALLGLILRKESKMPPEVRQLAQRLRTASRGTKSDGPVDEPSLARLSSLVQDT